MHSKALINSIGISSPNLSSPFTKCPSVKYQTTTLMNTPFEYKNKNDLDFWTLGE